MSLKGDGEAALFAFPKENERKVEGTFMGISTRLYDSESESSGSAHPTPLRSITDACCPTPELAFDSSPQIPSSFECLYYSTVSKY